DDNASITASSKPTYGREQNGGLIRKLFNCYLTLLRFPDPVSTTLIERFQNVIYLFMDFPEVLY
ncbi:MAG: hypothetical protein WBG61_02830, partial [Desulfobacterales bacterium]